MDNDKSLESLQLLNLGNWKSPALKVLPSKELRRLLSQTSLEHL